MNYELHDCYAHKFINYEIFGASFAILLCSSNLLQGLFSEHKQWMKQQTERISKEYLTLKKYFIRNLLPFFF